MVVVVEREDGWTSSCVKMWLGRYVLVRCVCVRVVVVVVVVAVVVLCV